MALPTNVAAAYPDDGSDPSIGLHQQHHDIIHAAVNAFMPVVVKTSAEWTTSDVVLQSGQFGVAADTGEIRSGNGAGLWDDLPSAIEEMAAAISGKVDKTAVPVSALDPAYGLTGTTDNTEAMQAALDAAATAGRNIHFPMRAGGQPYLVGGSGVMLKVAAGVQITADPGVVFKVKDNNGDYEAMLSGTRLGTDLSGLVVEGVTFDQNTANNPVTNNAALFAGYPRFAIYVTAGSGVTVRRCKFRNVDSVNTLVVNGAKVANVRIEDNDFELIGTSSGQHDHSTIYTSASGQVITGNVFNGVSGGLGATTAIETHGAQQVVTHNRVRDYFCGANITGVANAGNRAVVVAHNVIHGVMIGIDLWSYTGTNGGLKDCTVAHNTVVIDRDDWLGFGASAFPAGIMLNPTNTATIDVLKIHGNTIHVLPFSSAAKTGELKAAGIALWHVDAAVEVWDLDVYDNTVKASLSAGLRLAVNVKRGKISRNRFVDPGSSTETAMASFYRSGITIVGTQVDLIVENNETFDTRGTHLVAQGVMTSMTAATRCVQRMNSVTCTDGTSVPNFVQTAGKPFATTPEAPVAPRFKAGLYYGPEGSRSVVTTTAGTLTAVPFWVPVAQAFDRIGTEVTVAGVASSVVRLGVYSDNGSGLPGVLVFEAGTLAADSTGAKEIKISKTLSAGLYWLGLVGQGGTPQVRAVTNNILGGAGVSTLALATGATPRPGYYMAGVSGALPHTWTMSGQTATPGVVVLRAA